jgi:hypothetical protein
MPEMNGRSWADFVWFSCFFAIGYIIAADDLTDAAKKAVAAAA